MQLPEVSTGVYIHLYAPLADHKSSSFAQVLPMPLPATLATNLAAETTTPLDSISMTDASTPRPTVEWSRGFGGVAPDPATLAVLCAQGPRLDTPRRALQCSTVLACGTRATP